jgi:anti-sigma factor RsiW
MTCEKVEPELVGYHFGLLPDDLRLAVETHLVSCPECLRGFIEMKRAIEIGEEDGPAPSEAAHARLRLAVAAELGVEAAMSPGRKPRRWERPVALAIAASFVLLANRATIAMTSGPGSPPHAISRGGVSR